MKIKLSELKQVIREAFTDHQVDLMISMLQSAQRNVEKYVRYLSHGEGNKNEILSGLSSSTKEIRGWAPVFGRHHPKMKTQADRVLQIITELDKDSVKPFNGLFKGKAAKRAQELYKELTTICANDLHAPEYSENYGDLDDRHFSVKSSDKISAA